MSPAKIICIHRNTSCLSSFLQLYRKLFNSPHKPDPPLTAGTINISVPSGTFVAKPSAKRIASSPTKMLMCWRTSPCSSTMRSRSPGWFCHSASSAALTVAGEPSTFNEFCPSAKAARYFGIRKLHGMAYLFLARARLLAVRFDDAVLGREPLFLALGCSVSLCLRGEPPASPSINAALTHTTGGKPSRIACHDLPSSFEP